MSRDYDDGARNALLAARAILGSTLAREIEAAPTDKIKLGLIIISKVIEKRLRKYEVTTGLVTIADTDARDGYLYADIDKQNLSPLTPEPTESVSARAKLAVDLGYEEKP